MSKFFAIITKVLYIIGGITIAAGALVKESNSQMSNTTLFGYMLGMIAVGFIFLVAGWICSQISEKIQNNSFSPPLRKPKFFPGYRPW
jgi:hypothetical protein